METETSARIDRARAALQARGMDALIVTPGSNLRYLTGYHGSPETERLTALVLDVHGGAHLLAPRLEVPLAEASLSSDLDLPVLGWEETEDPLAMLVDLLPTRSGHVAVDERMWAARSLALRSSCPGLDQVSAADVMGELRILKSPDEIASLRGAGSAIDSVHAEMAQWLRPGRTERQVGADVADAIVQAGHRSADFVIVASGPNGASPHADLTDRVVEPGDVVVVDIGGSMPDGYRSDSTRTYAVGDVAPEVTRTYDVLLSAQREQCERVRAGMTAHELDAIGRDLITDAGYGEQFLHRTGHGIGLDTHEDPYVVAGSTLTLQPGMAFSIEPGIYHAGRFGSRIEDIVVCTENGGERLNTRPRDLVVL